MSWWEAFFIACGKSSEVFGRCKSSSDLQFAPQLSLGILWVLTLGGWVFCLTMHVGVLPACCLSITPVRNLDNALEVHKDSASYQSSRSWCSLAHVNTFHKAQDTCCTVPFPPWVCSRCRCVSVEVCGCVLLGHSSLGTWKLALEFWV